VFFLCYFFGTAAILLVVQGLIFRVKGLRAAAKLLPQFNSSCYAALPDIPATQHQKFYR